MKYTITVTFLFLMLFNLYCQTLPLYVPTDSLVAWYPLDGNGIDLSGNNHNGIMYNNPIGTTNRFNIANNALLFSGTNQYIRITSLDTLNYKPISYSAWVIVNSYFPSSFGHKFRTIIGRVTAFQTNCAALGFYADNNAYGGQYDNRFLYWRGGGVTGNVPASNIQPPLNTWIHLVYTQNSNGDFKIYINGQLDNSGNFTNPLNYFNQFRIGNCNNASGFPWNDKLDDIGVWRKVLSDCEVKALYESNLPDTLVITSCEFFASTSGKTYTTSGLFVDTLQNINGCDSLRILDLTILESSIDTINIEACEFLIMPISGDTINFSGTFSDTISSSSGCDSIIVVNGIINYNSSTIDVLSSCDSLTWIDGNTYLTSNNTNQVTLSTINGCDSVVTLDLTIHYSNNTTDYHQACKKFTWIDSVTYFENNNSAQYIYSNMFGCDSVVLLDLIIRNVDTNVISTPPTLQANADSATFQWINCANNQLIDSARSNFFTAEDNGSYAVIVTQNGCSDTSSCYQIKNVGLFKIPDAFASIYPNPSSNNITIQCQGNFKFEFRSMDGRTVMSGIGSNETNCVLDKLSRGVYTLIIKNSKRTVKYKVILN